MDQIEYIQCPNDYKNCTNENCAAMLFHNLINDDLIYTAIQTLYLDVTINECILVELIYQNEQLDGPKTSIKIITMDEETSFFSDSNKIRIIIEKNSKKYCSEIPSNCKLKTLTRFTNLLPGSCHETIIIFDKERVYFRKNDLKNDSYCS